MPIAVILLICWPLAELFVAIRVAEAIGVLDTIVLLIATWPIGIWALRSGSRAAWRRLLAAAAEGRPPAREVVDGALILTGGALLILPGFITDVVGALMLLPPSRALGRAALIRNFQSRFVVQAARFSGRAYDVDSTAHDVDQPRLRP